jgi:aminoglycoside phosphotransferase (APT) family kinase protein
VRGPVRHAPEHDLARELWATDAARAAGVPTPRLLAAKLAPADGSPPLVVQEHVAGEPGHQAALEPGERAVVLAEMGAIAARVHAVVLPGAGQLRAVDAGYAGTSRSWAAFTVEALERRLGELAALGDETVPAEMADAVRRRFAAGQPELEAAVPTGAPTSALLHADFRLQNAIVARDAAGVARVAAVLDFEMAMCGDGAVDLAWLTYQDACGRADAAAILRGYGVSATATGLRERLRLYQLHYALGHLWWKASFRDGPGAAEVIDRIRRLLAGRD